jgi:hypothetical protein
VTAHPCRWTPAVLDAIEPLIVELGLPVHDPFAGTGERLGQLCDRLGVPFTGTELEAEYIADRRVRHGDSTDADTYPTHPFGVVTSPVYPNGMTDHFHARDDSRRHTYRQGLAEIRGYDRPLHPNNMGRYGNRYRRSQASEDKHFAIADLCVGHWPRHAFVNVKDVVTPSYTVEVVARWQALLEGHGYEVVDVVEVSTPGQRHGANRDHRADGEAIIVARAVALDDRDAAFFLSRQKSDPCPIRVHVPERDCPVRCVTGRDGHGQLAAWMRSP